MIGVRAGTLDDPEIGKPQMTIWTSSAPRGGVRPQHPARRETGPATAGGEELSLPAWHFAPVQQKTDRRVVRLLTKYVGAEGRSIEQWFLVAIGDDDKATDAVAKSANAADAAFEIVGHIPATALAGWGMTARFGLCFLVSQLAAESL
jgi:hypothetical protein